MSYHHEAGLALGTGYGGQASALTAQVKDNTNTVLLSIPTFVEVGTNTGTYVADVSLGDTWTGVIVYTWTGTPALASVTEPISPPKYGGTAPSWYTAGGGSSGPDAATIAAAILVTPQHKLATDAAGNVSVDPTTRTMPETVWDGSSPITEAHIATALMGEVMGSEGFGTDGVWGKQTAGGNALATFDVLPAPTAAASRTRRAGTPVPVPAAATFVALGAWTPPGGSPFTGSTAAAYQTSFAQPAAIIHYYQDLVHSPNFNASQASEVTSHGGIPLISWELDDYTGGINQTAYSNASFVAGTHDAALITWLNAAAAWNQPFLLRPFWEMSGAFYPWAAGANGNTPGSFIDAWRHVFLLARAHAPKAQLVWCPSVEITGAGLLPLEDCYPGNAYVDVLSLDGYNKSNAAGNSNPGGAWYTFSDVFSASYTRIAALHPTKPILIAETGCHADSRRPAWIAAIPAALDAMPRIDGVCWWNNQQTGSLDCRLTADSPTLAAYQALAALPQMQGTWT